MPGPSGDRFGGYDVGRFISRPARLFSENRDRSATSPDGGEIDDQDFRIQFGRRNSDRDHRRSGIGRGSSANGTGTGLTEALQAAGFVSWEEIELDDDGPYWDVDDARMADGRRYDLKLDPKTFEIIDRDLED